MRAVRIGLLSPPAFMRISLPRVSRFTISFDAPCDVLDRSDHLSDPDIAHDTIACDSKSSYSKSTQELCRRELQQHWFRRPRTTNLYLHLALSDSDLAIELGDGDLTQRIVCPQHFDFRMLDRTVENRWDVADVGRHQEAH